MARFGGVWGVGGVVLLLAACGGAPAAEVSQKPAPELASGMRANVAEAPAAPALPDTVPDLSKLVPKDAMAVVGVPTLDALTKGMDPTILATAGAKVSEEIGASLGVSPALGAKILAAYDGAVVFVDHDLAKSPKGAAILRVKDASVIEPLAQAAKLQSTGKGRWSSGPIHVAWLDRASVLIIANDAGTLERTLAVATGSGASFAESELRGEELKGTRRPEELWLAVDLHAVSKGALPGAMESGSRLAGTIDFATGLDLHYRQLGAKVPRLGSVLAPSAQDAVANLPAGAVLAWGLSVKRAPQKSLADVLSEIGRPDGKDLTPLADGLLAATGGPSIAEIDRALGDEIALGAYAAGGKLAVGPDFAKSGAVLVTISTRDDAIAGRVIDLLGKSMRGEKGVKSSPGKVSLTKDGISLDVSVQKGRVVLVMGGTQPTARLKARALASKDRLGVGGSFEAGRKTAPALSHTLLFADFDAIVKMLPAQATASLGAVKIGPVFFALSLRPSDKGVDLDFKGSGGLGVVSAIGTMSALGIYGVRRYLQSAKSSEAKNTIGAIARGAMAGYEREKINGAHALCGSAPPVPRAVPAGTKYQPSSTPGQDFETGTVDAGWKCLRFSITNPHYYQYEYRVGGGYKGPKRGGPDPGKDGFEASAEGDLDGDGQTSLFTITGTVTPAGVVKLSTEIFTSDEFE